MTSKKKSKKSTKMNEEKVPVKFLRELKNREEYDRELREYLKWNSKNDDEKPT